MRRESTARQRYAAIMAQHARTAQRMKAARAVIRYPVRVVKCQKILRY